jgi:hypothetical protein
MTNLDPMPTADYVEVPVTPQRLHIFNYSNLPHKL